MPAARLLDLTRLVSRLGRGPLTGVDRVELAWLDHLIEGEAHSGLPLFALVRMADGFALLDGPGARAVAALARGADLPAADLRGRLGRRRDPLRARAETAVRRLARAQTPMPLLGWMLARHVPPDTPYFNVGHANLTPQVLGAMRGQVVVLVHDTIPLDYPQFTRPDIPMVFGRKMAAVSGRADLVVHSTAAARQATERHFVRMGRVPPAVVAPLGVDVPAPGRFPDLPGLDPRRPWFLAIGTIEPRKNHALLLDVWEQLATRLAPNQMPQLVIAGSRGWRNEAVFRRLDARPPHVIEVADLPDPALAALLYRSHGLLFPSHAEGFGLPPVEAAALGVPAYLSDLPVFHEVLGDYPVYLPVDAVYSWVETIAAVLAGGERANSPDGGVGGMKPALALPSWDTHFNAVLRNVR